MSDFDLIPTDGGELAPLDSGSLSPTDFETPEYWVPPGDTPNYGSPGQQGSFFGMPVEGVSVGQLQKEIVEPICQLVSQEMQSRGVPARYINAAVGWIMGNAARQQVRQGQTHAYDVSGFRIEPQDRIPVTNFLNHCDDHGVPANVVRLFLSFWFVKLPQLLESSMQQSAPPAGNPQFATVDSLSDKQWEFVKKKADGDQIRAEQELRNRWGGLYEQNMQTVRAYIRQMPQAEQNYLMYGVAPDGTMLANSAELMMELHARATGLDKPPVDLLGEIASLEKYMRDNRAAYIKDEQAQARLRRLYQLRDEGN